MSGGLRSVARDLRAHARLFASLGVGWVGSGHGGPPLRGADRPPAPRSAASSPRAEAVPSEKGVRLAALERQAKVCVKCALSKGRTQVVFGTGDPDAGLVFVGEAPGRDEDRTGIPFVGRAGQLLTDIIEKGLKIPRASVYICNVIKCRPPENRAPRVEEIVACSPWLAGQLAILSPKVICALGTFAAQTLLETPTPISSLRGREWRWQGIPVICTFHPAYLLRNPAEKKRCWEDVRRLIPYLAPV